MTTNAPGRLFLLITGILLAVFSVIGFFSTAFTLVIIDYWLPAYGGWDMREVWMLFYGAGMLLSLYAVVVGILGAVFHNKINKGGLLLCLMVISLTLSVIHSIVYTVAVFYYDNVIGFASLVSIPFSLVLPILFIVGAVKNKKAADFVDEYGNRRH